MTLLVANERKVIMSLGMRQLQLKIVWVLRVGRELRLLIMAEL